MRAAPRGTLPTLLLARIVHAALPGCRVLGCEPLGDGFRNANFKLCLDPEAEPVVLRIYEHDPSLCQKELDLIRLVGGAIPVPEVIFAEPGGWEDLPPFAILRWVDGITFRDLKRSGDAEAMEQAAHSVGQALAAIGRFRFPKPGWLGPGPAAGPPLLEGAHAVPRFVDLCLASQHSQRRMTAELRDRTHDLTWSWARQLARLEGAAHLVHGDFNKRNLIVRRNRGRWSVAAVLDWEFAVSSSPLADIGNFLRYERAARPAAEPHFSNGYRHAGGSLPPDWRRLARILDLIAICESLSRAQLPEPVIPELVELVRATIEDRDPAFA